METFRELIRELCIGVYNDDVDTDEFIEKTCGMLDTLKDNGHKIVCDCCQCKWTDKTVEAAKALLRGKP